MTAAWLWTRQRELHYLWGKKNKNRPEGWKVSSACFSPSSGAEARGILSPCRQMLLCLAKTGDQSRAGESIRPGAPWRPDGTAQICSWRSLCQPGDSDSMYHIQGSCLPPRLPQGCCMTADGASCSACSLTLWPWAERH